MTADLIEFLRARLDEDEEAARDALRVMSPGGLYVGSFCVHLPPEVQQHNDRHDPARVLREIDAKRAAVLQYERSLENSRAHPEDLATSGALLARLGTVKLIAAVYADHPDYRQEWAP